MWLSKLKSELIRNFNSITIEIILIDKTSNRNDYDFIVMWVDGINSIRLFHSGLEVGRDVSEVISTCKENLRTMSINISELLD